MQAAMIDRPVLHLSGPRLTNAFERLIAACEEAGGIEKFVDGLKLKGALFTELLGDGKVATLPQADFEELSAFMATVRRRVGRGIEVLGYQQLRTGLTELLADGHDATTADARLAAFVAVFPDDKAYRWVRDLGAEVLHHLWPEHYPMMSRWVWDRRANTGVLREIWHGDNVDHIRIDVPDTYATFLMLREELSQFLSDNGLFRDMLYYNDLLQAQVYADYINAQGGTYLRTDFSSEGDPLEHVRRILGLDGGAAKFARPRMKTVGAAEPAPADIKHLN